jgi:glutamyl-tRNA(Gln) amidotransferase subunit E
LKIASFISLFGAHEDRMLFAWNYHPLPEAFAVSADFDPESNYRITRELVGYLPRRETPAAVYRQLGFKCGLEIHQQLLTRGKLFCRCPAGIYQQEGEFDAELVRHMRPTLSELGEYDGTALMEFKTRKNIIYRIKDETACTYDIDDTPPFPIDRQALESSVKIALLLKTNIVGELHITRKQYLDGSIPTGFQRTAIVGIEGEIPLRRKKIRVIQLSVEEDACREWSDIGHWRVYSTDRLGMPLIETVTYPDMTTPAEAAEAGHYLRFLARSSGLVRTGIGAAREDVNVSIEGGTRVEIKGVQHIRWIPELTHNEGLRQKGLLMIRDQLRERIGSPDSWQIESKDLGRHSTPGGCRLIDETIARGESAVAVNLPKFRGILSHFTQPGQMFADEISGRLKVVACIEHPNMIHSEPIVNDCTYPVWHELRELFKASHEDAQLVILGPEADMPTALETVDERCKLAFEGVPNETRKGLPDGTTIFERVLPGPDRMYPDTDSPPLPLTDEFIENCRRDLPQPVSERQRQLAEWGVPDDCHEYLLRRNLLPILERIIALDFEPRQVGTVFGHKLKHLEGHEKSVAPFSYNKVYGLFKFIQEQGLNLEIVDEMLPVVYQHPKMEFESVLNTIGFSRMSSDDIMGYVPLFRRKFAEIHRSSEKSAEVDWIMGQLRPLAAGNMRLAELAKRIEQGS